MATNAMSPFTDRIARLRELGGKALDAVSHPINTVESALGIPLAAPSSDPHQAAIDEMNKQANAQRAQQATQSFAPRRGMPSK